MVSDMQHHCGGQRLPPNVIQRAMRSFPSKEVRLSAAVAAERWARWYAALTSNLPMRILTCGWWLLMLTIWWSIWCSVKPNMQFGSSSFLSHLLTDRPEGPGKVWSCVIWSFFVICPSSSIDSCSMMPSGAAKACGIFIVHSTVSGKLKSCMTSSSMSVFIVSWCSWADLWLPHSNMNAMSIWWLASEISSRGKVAPSQRMSFTFFHNGCLWRMGLRDGQFLNSDP